MTHLKPICKQRCGIKRYCIPSLYAQSFMGNDFKYISDQRTVAQLGRINILGSVLVFLPTQPLVSVNGKYADKTDIS